MNLTAAELVSLAEGAGTGGDPSTAAAVALAESGGDPAAIGRNQDGSRDRGLWQINDRFHPDVTDACAFDPACNARSAYAISSGWTDFSPWTTFQSGAYRQFLPQTTTAEQQTPDGRSLFGASVVGQMVTSPWFHGTWEVTQGYGPTDYDGEPEGHGYAHWHAGVDVGLDCGTTVIFPPGLSATARSLDNPDGYGSALVLLVDGGPAILLGHLRQRLVDDGARLTGGEEIAQSNNTGNSTGCHLHFEVRPQDSKRPLGMAAYGSDMDPSTWLMSASGNPNAQLLAFNPGQSIGDAFAQANRAILAGGEILLGSAVVLTGVIATAYGLRGQPAGQLQRDAVGQARRLMRPRAQPRRRPAPKPSPAAESRVRPDLQRQVPEEAPRERAMRKLREGRQGTMTPEEAAAIGARPR